MGSWKRVLYITGCEYWPRGAKALTSLEPTNICRDIRPSKIHRTENNARDVDRGLDFVHLLFPIAQQQEDVADTTTMALRSTATRRHHENRAGVQEDDVGSS